MYSYISEKFFFTLASYHSQNTEIYIFVIDNVKNNHDYLRNYLKK